MLYIWVQEYFPQIRRVLAVMAVDYVPTMFDLVMIIFASSAKIS